MCCVPVHPLLECANFALCRYGAAEVFSFAPDYDRFPKFLEAECFLDDVSRRCHAGPEVRVWEVWGGVWEEVTT